MTSIATLRTALIGLPAHLQNHTTDSAGAILRDGIAAGLFVLAVVVICLAMGG